jgi:hypothetical protein
VTAVLLVVVPVLLLALLFVLQELEQWALKVPKPSLSEKGQQESDGQVPRTPRIPHPRSAE